MALPDQSVVSFKYDPFGRRIRKVAGSTTVFVYDGANIIEEVDGSGNVLARYTMSLGIDEPLAMLRSASTSYYHADGLGSITSLSDSSGALAATYSYDSFGSLTNSTGALANAIRYTARESDPEINLYFYRARYFSPTTGRFLTEDPIRFSGGPNFYTYVSNNPLRYFDPFGLPEMEFRENWRRVPGKRWGWHSGETNLRGPDVQSECVCVDGGWQMRMEWTFHFDISFDTEGTRQHEERHVGAVRDFIRGLTPKYERYEHRTFPTLADCETYRRRLTTFDFGPPELREELKKDKAGWDKAGLGVDPWWQRCLFHGVCF